MAHTLCQLLLLWPLRRYLHIVTPALLLYSIHDCIDRFLISQSVVRPSLTIASLCSSLTPLLSWLFISKQGMGLEGAGYAYLSVQVGARAPEWVIKAQVRSQPGAIRTLADCRDALLEHFSADSVGLG